MLEQGAAFSRRVAQMQNDIRDCIIIELTHIRRQFNTPCADYACSLELQVALISKICFKPAAILLCATGNDGLNGADIVNKAIIISFCIPCILSPDRGVLPKTIFKQRERAVDAGVRPSDTGNSKT